SAGRTTRCWSSNTWTTRPTALRDDGARFHCLRHRLQRLCRGLRTAADRCERPGRGFAREASSGSFAAVGETTVVRFDSGYEVWVYPIADDSPESPRSTRARSEMER